MALIKSAFNATKICQATGTKYHINQTGSSALICYLPAFGEKAEDYGYFFKGKNFEKLNATGVAIESPYTDEKGALINEK